MSATVRVTKDGKPKFVFRYEDMRKVLFQKDKEEKEQISVYLKSESTLISTAIWGLSEKDIEDFNKSLKEAEVTYNKIELKKIMAKKRARTDEKTSTSSSTPAKKQRVSK